MAPGFEKVRDHFEALFKEHDRRSQLCIYVGDEKVVDLWGDTEGDYGPDKIQNIFSSGKSVGAILMGVL